MTVWSTRKRIMQTWKRWDNIIDHALKHLQKLDYWYENYPEHRKVVRMLSQMLVDAQMLARAFYKEKV